MYQKLSTEDIEMIVRMTLTILILAGAAVVVYFYHLRPRRFDPSARQRVTSWRPYELIDWYLKISTLAISLAAIHWDHPLLLEAHLLENKVEDLFGRWLAMDFMRFIRHQRRFETKEHLKQQIAKDTGRAEQMLF